MKPNKHLRWTLGELLRFEGYRLQDRAHPETDLEQRDRSFYQQALSSSADSDISLPQAYAYWLQQRWQNDPLQPDPARLFQRSFSWLSLILVIAGLISGASLAYACLYYDGRVPVNVALFLGVLVLPQLLLLLFLFLSLILSSVASGWFAHWYALPARLGESLLLRLWRRRGLSTEKQEEWSQQGKVLRETMEVHRALFANRVFRAFQSMGIAFNIGALLCLGLLLAFTDRAFGWQSSLTASPQTVHDIVSALAWPWHFWLGEGLGYPDLQQISGSRIVLRESGAGTETALSSTHLLSWWPFLMMCLLVYGLLPRLLGWLMSCWLESRWLRAPDFSGFHHQALWRRMRSIELRSAGRPSEHRQLRRSEAKPRSGVEEVPLEVFILEETGKRYSEPYLESWVQSLTGYQGAINKVQDITDCVTSSQGEPQVFLVLEGWQPPIEETLAALVDCAKGLQQQQQALHLLLLGKPAPGKPGGQGSAPLSERLSEVWRKKLNYTEQPNLYVHTES